MNDYVFMTDREFQEYQKGGKVKSRVNEAGNYTKPSMRKRLFQKIKAGSKGGNPGQWSARKAQMLAREYKAKGGGYKQDGGYAITPFERKYGILAGKNKFKFPVRAEQQMTMNPGGLPLSFPVYYKGLVNGIKSDEGIAMPGQDFKVYGDEVHEYPIYKKGGAVNKYNITKAQEGTEFDYELEGYSPISNTSSAITNSNNITNRITPMNVNDVITKEDEAGSDFAFDSPAPKQGFLSRYINKFKRDPEDYYKVESYDIPYASMAYNMSRFAEGPDEVPLRTNPYESSVLSGLRNTRIRSNYRPAMLAQNKAINQVRSSSTSVPQMMANLQNMNANIQGKMIDADMVTANQNAQLAQRYYDTMRTMGQERANRMSTVDDINRRNREAQMNYLAQNASMFDDIRKQKRTLDSAKRQDQMNVLGMNMQAGDIKYAMNPDGTISTLYRDPISGEWKPMNR